MPHQYRSRLTSPAFPDARAAILAMRRDPWGGDVHTALASAAHGGIDVALFAVRSEGCVPAHAHAYHELLIPLASSKGQHIGWQIGDERRRTVSLHPGSLLLVNAGQRHAADWNGEWMRLGVKIDPAWFTACVRQTFGMAGAHLGRRETAIVSPDLVSLAQRLLVTTNAVKAEADLLMFVWQLLRTAGIASSITSSKSSRLSGERLRIALEALDGRRVRSHMLLRAAA